MKKIIFLISMIFVFSAGKSFASIDSNFIDRSPHEIVKHHNNKQEIVKVARAYRVSRLSRGAVRGRRR